MWSSSSGPVAGSRVSNTNRPPHTTESSASSYLALANVGCVGGSWVTPPDALREHDWARVTRLATEATYLQQ